MIQNDLIGDVSPEGLGKLAKIDVKLAKDLVTKIASGPNAKEKLDKLGNADLPPSVRALIATKLDEIENQEESANLNNPDPTKPISTYA